MIVSTVHPTTTANPIAVFAAANLANYNSFFVLALLGQDTTAIVAKQAALVASMGGNATISDQLLNALESLLPILTNTPDAAQKALIAEKVGDEFKLTTDLVASFPGMENFETNPNLLEDPLNAAFYALYNQLKTEAQNLIANPALALAYFSDPAVQAKLASIISLAIEVSLQTRDSKSNTSLRLDPVFNAIIFAKLKISSLNKCFSVLRFS